MDKQNRVMKKGDVENEVQQRTSNSRMFTLVLCMGLIDKISKHGYWRYAGKSMLCPLLRGADIDEYEKIYSVRQYVDSRMATLSCFSTWWGSPITRP